MIRRIPVDIWVALALAIGAVPWVAAAMQLLWR